MQTYLHKNVEVRTTGRVARKEQETRRNKEGDTVLLHEVTPIDNEVGSWKAWVDLKDLFLIEEATTDE